MTEEKVETKTSWGEGGFFGNRSLGSLALIILCPVFCITLLLICRSKHYLLDDFLKLVQDGKYLSELGEYANPFNAVAWKMILSYMAFELFLMKVVPGKLFRANPTATGHVPEYIANGVPCYLITIAVVFVLHFYTDFKPSLVYDHMGSLICSMSIFAFIFCGFLTFKGLYFPSTKDFGSSGDFIVDFFWGTELYPRIFGFDVKQFTNCRFGMMFWQVGILCYAFKQYDTFGFVSSSMLVSVILQTVYIAKFFVWETGYFCSMDIQHDRAGYYICWGCLVWVPSIYTVHTYYLTIYPILLSIPTTIIFTTAGLFCIWCNYDCDRQRQDFRKSGGRIKIWGEEAQYIVAKYTTGEGEERSSLLLYNGWWGLARHFHYVPEILASVFWCVPTVLTTGAVVPFFYPIYLTLLLLDRAWRDDARCAEKYKEDWKRYCAKVPYKIIPGVI